MNPNFYDILRVSPSADIATIRTSYRRAALLAHPDKGGSTELFHEVTLAFETLVNKQSRDEYDKLHNISASLHSPKKNLKQAKKDAYCKRPIKIGKEKMLDRLRCVLQAFTASERKSALGNMEPFVRQALFEYMKVERPRLEKCETNSETTSNEMPAHIPKSGAVGVHQFGQLYRASVSMANLEVYSGLRARVEKAIEDHAVLSQIREDVLTAMALRRSDNQVLEIVRDCLADFATSEDAIQLSAKVRIRASEWIGAARISSPTMSFPNAIRLRSRLLRAKRSSWQEFRAECVSLLQREKTFQGRARKRTLHEAEAFTDRAWASAKLKRDWVDARRSNLLRRLVRSIKAKLDVEADRAKKAKVRKRWNAKKKFKTTLHKARDELRRWHRRSDLTMEEIIRGPPAHLRHPSVQKCF